MRMAWSKSCPRPYRKMADDTPWNARVRLICTLTYELDVDDSALPLVLSLLDQLYDTRQRLFSLTRAIKTQDETVQLAIAAASNRSS